MGKNTKSDNHKKWDRIYHGEIPDDFTNPMLSHFGFWDDGMVMEKNKERRDMREAEFRTQKFSGANNGFNSSE